MHLKIGIEIPPRYIKNATFVLILFSQNIITTKKILNYTFM